MAEARLMDQAFQHIMRTLVERGHAPHYAELARAVDLPVAEGRQLLLDVILVIGALEIEVVSAEKG